MDARINARYYRVSDRPNVAQLDFCDLLEQEFARSPADRERDVGFGAIIRLERFERIGEFVYGEMSRIQRVNIPPAAGPEGLEPITLGEGQGIGHVSAFQYHTPTRVIVLQRNVQGATPGRIAQYLAQIAPAALFKLSPVLRKDALERMAEGPPKRLKVGFAAPLDLTVVEDVDAPGLDNLQRLGEIFDSPEVEVTFSVGRQRGVYLDRTSVRRLVRGLSNSPIDIKTLEMTVETETGVDPIDFIGDALRLQEEADLPEGNPERNYRVRRAILASSFQDNLEYILDYYGARVGDGGN